MRSLQIGGAGLTLVLLLLVAVGCNQKVSPPAPLPVAELPSALEKAFSKAKPEVKDLVGQVVQAVQSKDYTRAFAALQALSGTVELSKDQASLVGRATLTINELLQSAEAKGDEKAATTLENYRKTK